jgi:hypothetical protein
MDGLFLAQNTDGERHEFKIANAKPQIVRNYKYEVPNTKYQIPMDSAVGFGICDFEFLPPYLQFGTCYLELAIWNLLLGIWAFPHPRCFNVSPILIPLCQISRV